MPFQHANRSAVIKSLNNAPGGSGGVDIDIQQRLGAPGLDPSLSTGERQHGICCGISGSWLMGVLNKVKDATDTKNFNAYFNNVLRFQGAILKDQGGTPSEIHDNVDSLRRMFGGRTVEVENKSVSIADFGEALPHGEKLWGAYLSAWKHAIAVCKANGNWFIMDPNNGLYEYKKRPVFVSDATEYLTARLNKKSKSDPTKFTSASKLKVYVWEPA